MSEIRRHVERMQAMAARYLMPEGYTAYDGASAAAQDNSARDYLFIADMLYMLDGPEQRAAFEASDAAALRARNGEAG